MAADWKKGQHMYPFLNQKKVKQPFTERNDTLALLEGYVNMIFTTMGQVRAEPEDRRPSAELEVL
jgi:hypothetical protein